MTGKSKTFLRGDKLTAEEVLLFQDGCCPDCLEQDLLVGPKGNFVQGIDMNCGNCKSVFHNKWTLGVWRLSTVVAGRRTAYRN